MSSERRKRLVSTCFWWPGQRATLEIVHQRGPRALRSLSLAAWSPDGRALSQRILTADRQWWSLDDWLAPLTQERVMVVCDATYDAADFPYRPHHYLHVDGDPPLYLAVAAGRVGKGTAPLAEYAWLPGQMDYRVVVGNFGPTWRTLTLDAKSVDVGPRGHVEVPLTAGAQQVRATCPSRLATYLVGHHQGRLAVYDHLYPQHAPETDTAAWVARMSRARALQRHEERDGDG